MDEKSALQISTVYACVRLLAETVASLPLHLYRFTEKGDGKERATEHPLYKILYRQANPEMTSFSFREAMMMLENQGISFVQYTLMPWLTRFEQAIIKDVLIEEELDS